MYLFCAFFTIIFSIFSTVVMSYISMAMPLGPWIGPTIALMSMVLFRFLPITNQTKKLAIITAGSSVGGIVATGFGFSFPTLYFLQPALFNDFLQKPYYFALLMGFLTLAAGSVGIGIANCFEHQLLQVEKLSFPIGQLVYKLISLGNGLRKAYQLAIGFIGTTLFCALQDGIGRFAGFIPKSLTLFTGYTAGFVQIPLIRFDIWPMLWAIGFIAGHLITIPLLVGAVAKYVLVNPLHAHWFSVLSNTEALFAFCSGMVLYGAIFSFIGLPGLVKTLLKNKGDSKKMHVEWMMITEVVVGLLISVAFFSWAGFSLLSQIFIITLTALFTYQIMGIAGKIGLAPLGRFATFVMLPAMFLFSLSYLQIVLIATFVEVCGGVAADILFGRKTAELADVSRETVKRYQYLGLCVSALTVGMAFWVLITKLGLGSNELFAYKAQSRQLLIGAKQFNWYLLGFGAIFSFILKQFKVNAVLVLGGLLMPIPLSLGLIFGGILTYLVPNKDEAEPFWSGVFVANSIWMFLQALR